MFYYDEEGDILDISIGNPKKAKSQEIGNDIIVRRDEKGNVVGFTILNFEKRAEAEKGFNIPIEAKFGVSS